MKYPKILLIIAFASFMFIVAFSCDARFAVPQIISISFSPNPANPGDTVTVTATTAKGIKDTKFVRADLTAFGLGANVDLFDDATGGDLKANDGVSLEIHSGEVCRYFRRMLPKLSARLRCR